MTTAVSENKISTRMADTVPFAKARMGSWQVSIRRQVHAHQDLVGRYDRAATNWARTAKRFQLADAYKGALSRSRIAFAPAGTAPVYRVLDCGIGAGSLTLALDSILPNGTQFTGIDISGDMLAHAAANLYLQGVKPELRLANVGSIPYADASFDIVMAAHVLEHLPDPMRGIREMVRVLKPGGRLFLCITRPSFFGTYIQFRWRTWAVSDRQGVAWLRHCELNDIGLHPLRSKSRARQASTAFWARKPAA